MNLFDQFLVFLGVRKVLNAYERESKERLAELERQEQLERLREEEERDKENRIL